MVPLLPFNRLATAYLSLVRLLLIIHLLAKFVDGMPKLATFSFSAIARSATTGVFAAPGSRRRKVTLTIVIAEFSDMYVDSLTLRQRR